MESGILAAGLTSLALGGAMTLLASNVIRGNRRREAARTALLSQLAFPGGMPGDPLADPQSHAVGRSRDDEFPRESSVAAETLFSKPESLGAISRRTAAVAAVSVAGAFAIGALLGWLSLDSSAAASASVRRPTDGVVSATNVAVPSSVRAPVELLALTHRVTPDALLVTGQVRNPAGGSPLNDIVAVVEVMDAADRVLETVRAPLTRRQLTAGEDSAFSASASVTRVARYRVEFQNAARVVIPHVDRREHAAKAQAG